MNSTRLITMADERLLPPLYAQDGLGREAIAHLKFFTPDASFTWYMTEYDSADRAGFGLVINEAMRDQCPEGELGYFSVDELEALSGPLGLPVERDQFFTPRPLSQCVEATV